VNFSVSPWCIFRLTSSIRFTTLRFLLHIALAPSMHNPHIGTYHPLKTFSIEIRIERLNNFHAISTFKCYSYHLICFIFYFYLWFLIWTINDYIFITKISLLLNYLLGNRQLLFYQHGINPIFDILHSQVFKYFWFLPKQLV
jgi:hypothetical protein